MKRFIAFLLVLATLLSVSVFCFTSCDEDDEPDNKGNDKVVENTDNIDNESGDIFAERAAVDDELGEGWDFGGRSFRVAGYNDGYEMFVSEDDVNKGDLIKDAKVARNKVVEDRFNISIDLVYSGSIYELNDYASKVILSGVDEIDLLVNHVLNAGQMVPKNLFLNWYDIPNVDFDKPWWAASNQEELTYDDKCLLAISDLNATAILCTCILVFNKNLAASYDFGNMYELVLNGEWTYDVMYELIKDVYIDSDGSGNDSTGDFYGGVFDLHDQVNAWLWAFDNPVILKNEEGVPELSIKTDKINSIITRIYDLMYNTTGTFFTNRDDHDVTGLGMFLTKQAIIAPTTLGMVTNQGLRSFEDEYGILPYPKYDEYQSDYVSHVYGEHACLAVPKTVKDIEYVGLITEALSAESWKTLTPTIYEIALKTRYLRDSESKEVLDILLENRYFDFGFVYSMTLSYTPYYMMKDKNQNFESYYSKNYKTDRQKLKRVLRAYDKID